ncbi:LPP20 family lipoprotein [Flavobacteriales bacterium]|nr:LPP20 family lipoprotein [Flavobacteriales bacterium]
MNKVYFFLILILLNSCSTQKKIADKTELLPLWIKEFPISQTHYIGIGVADKKLNPTDFIKVAQKNALQNLISQIKVSISSQSFLLKMERDLDFKQDIKSVIEIKADDVIEGYELVNSFTNNNEYWMYYRLNKSLYKEIKIAKTKEAVNESKFFLQKAISNSTSHKNQYIYFVSALNILEPYLNEPLFTKINGEEVNLLSEIITQFRAYLDKYQIRSLKQENLFTIGGNPFSLKFIVEQNNEKVPEIPLQINSSSLEINKFSEKTDFEGVLTANIMKFKNLNKLHKIEVIIDFQNWLEETSSSELIKDVFKNIKPKKIEVPIYLSTPKIFVNSTEKHHGELNNNNVLQFAVESELHNSGFSTVQNKHNADLIMTINSRSEKGRHINGQRMFVSFLNMIINVKDLNSRTIFSKNIDQIKGIQLDFNKADQNAYQQGVKEIKNKLIPEFINSLTTN